MVFDDQIRRYFGVDGLDQINPSNLEAGIERMAVDLGLESDSNRRFALWALLYMLGQPTDVDATFKDPTEREAARRFMDLGDAVVNQFTGGGASSQ
jgi:hypothetical protein